MQLHHWEKTLRKYFDGDEVQLCFVESNNGTAGKPLWPKDPHFDPAPVSRNIARAETALTKIGGHIFAAHLPLRSDRKFLFSPEICLNEPQALATTFVTGVLIPRERILESRIGYYYRDGEIPPLSEIVRPCQGTWLLTNLGYFLTERLIMDYDVGGLVYSHNTRHPKEDYLQPDDNSYLGGFFVRSNGLKVCYPPLFGTAGVAVLKNGQPKLVTSVRLGGGRFQLGPLSGTWTCEEINPADCAGKKVVLYTPALENEKTRVAKSNKDWRVYRNRIGAGRINVVVINKGTGKHPAPYIGYIREGEMIQPASGLVLSFERETFEKGCPGGIPFLMENRWEVRFDCDPWFDPKIWEEAECFYEGLIAFRPNGDPDFTSWYHPHAILTQETFIPNMDRREPRAVLVATKNYFGAFLFSGRYEYSIGTSFKEMGPIIHGVLKHWNIGEPPEAIVGLDSGSGAKLCWVENGELLPLFWAAPGPRNRMGDANGNSYSLLMMKV